MLSPVNGVNYFVAVQMPLPQVSTVSQLMNMPMASPSAAAGLSTAPGAPTLRLSDIAGVAPDTDMESINHYTVQRVIDVDANVDGRDLGAVAADIQKRHRQDQAVACPPPPPSPSAARTR